MEKGQICTRKHEHVLKVVGYLVWMPSGQVDQERERVNIGSSSYQNGEQGTSNEDKVPLVLGEGEHCYGSTGLVPLVPHALVPLVLKRNKKVKFSHIITVPFIRPRDNTQNQCLLERAITPRIKVDCAMFHDDKSQSNLLDLFKTQIVVVIYGSFISRAKPLKAKKEIS